MYVYMYVTYICIYCVFVYVCMYVCMHLCVCLVCVLTLRASLDKSRASKCVARGFTVHDEQVSYSFMPSF